ncbi:MAG: SMI1/KNR4 family protein [Lachnospiraceae bacterium]|nr:SMI1/KNR4 family protein [Lachnospiraceae bacterium]
MNYKLFFITSSVKCQKGLSDTEIKNIEDLYQIRFPAEYKTMLKQVLPVGKGFYNWRDLSEDNIRYIKEMISQPFKDIYDNASELDWNDNWGEEPQNKELKESIVREKLKEAPKLIPLYIHRYMPMMEGKGIPVISVSGTDIIYYGKNLNNYLRNEFHSTCHDTMDYSEIREIPFWSEVIMA